MFYDILKTAGYSIIFSLIHLWEKPIAWLVIKQFDKKRQLCDKNNSCIQAWWWIYNIMGLDFCQVHRIEGIMRNKNYNKILEVNLKKCAQNL